MPARAAIVFLVIALAIPLRAQDAPTENKYDIVSKVFRPFWSVLLVGGKDANKAASFRMVTTEVSGRLPKEFVGATLEAAVQFPNKVKLTAPVLGEQVTVCRNGNEVWAVPGEKVEFLLKQFGKNLPKPTKKSDTPIFIPVTAQQAVFLPALFVLEDGKQFEEIDGVQTRVISGGLMPDLAKVTESEDFRATMWVAAGYIPKKVRIVRRDFTMTVAIEDLNFAEKLPAKTWQPPEGAEDVYRTSADVLEQLLFVVTNSLGGGEFPPPAEDAAGPEAPVAE